MGLTSALNTSLIGLSLNETSIDVLGNNIANAGTNGFKGSQVRFQTQLSRTLTIGSRPTVTNGGTNPRQIGLGASVAVISKDFTQGSVANSTSPSDLAIQGDGFFVLEGSNGRAYTRNGNFSLNSASQLINDQGMFVQGYGVDSDYNLVRTQVQNLQIPLGESNVAQRTTALQLSGALLPIGPLGDRGTQILTEAMTDASSSAPAVTTSLLSDIQNAGGNNLFTVGETLQFSPRKGGRSIEPQTLEVTATTTVADLMAMMENTLGIQSGGGIANDAGTGAQPGLSLTGGQIQIVGNAGTVNAIGFTSGDLTSNGTVVPFSTTTPQDAVGESTSTDFVVYDSLGQPITVRMTAVLENRTTNATTYRYFLESAEDSRANIAVAQGTLTFDSEGRVTEGGEATFSLERQDSAAVSPMQITMDLSQLSGISTVQAGSRLNLTWQNGSSPGTLQSFVIDEGGVINGIYDNGLIRTLGQVVVARFPNPGGLIEDGSTTFKEGVSSGSPSIVSPGTFGAGTIRAGAIELSNTDIGRNLVDLIVASTNYRGNARVISSVQQLVDELLMLGGR
jgi:flagellar hook protein FlgE